jgi:hypothetical protein
MRSLLRWAWPALLAAWVVSTPEARAYNGHGRAETVYVSPVETDLAVPTSYVTSTSSALTTAYISPTIYTSAYVPTTYYLSPTAYVIPSYRATRYLAPRRVVERPVYTTTRYYYDATPTTYYTPTVVDYPVATSYESPCETTASSPTVTSAPSVSSSVRRAPRATAPAASSATVTPRRSPPPVVSEPKEEPPLQAEPKAATDNGAMSPPAEPAPPKPDDTPPTVPSDIPNPGLAPLEPETPPVPPQARETLKPVAPSGGILEGKVVSGTTGRAEKGVRIVVSHRRLPLAFVDREATTDALGRYAIDMPPGDWAVKVVGSNGKTYSVKNITVGGGRVTTDDGQAVPSLVINL